MIDISDVLFMLNQNLDRARGSLDSEDWYDALYTAIPWVEVFADLTNEPARQMETLVDMRKALDEIQKQAIKFEALAFYDNEISQHVVTELCKENPNFGFGAEHAYIDMPSLVTRFLFDHDYVSVKRNDGELIWFKSR